MIGSAIYLLHSFLFCLFSERYCGQKCCCNISYPQSVDDCGFAVLFTGSELNSTTDNYLNDLALCDKLLDSRREFPRDTLHAERFCKFGAVHRGSAELLQNFLTVFRIFVRRSLQKVRVNRNSYRKKTDVV